MGSETLLVYHTGFSPIPQPDLFVGRRNADFGQGFYLSDDRDFAIRWARERKGMAAVLNRYELDLTGLSVRRLSLDEAWYGYIFANRAGQPDALRAYDVVMGPIACDTLYDTWGILTSGLVERELALKAYGLGPAYEQIVLKSEKALAALRFLEAVILSPEQLSRSRAALREEEQAYQEALFTLLDPEGTN